MSPVIQNLANSQLEIAQKRIEEGEEAIPELWFLNGNKMAVSVLKVSFSPKIAAKALILASRCDMYTFISEAWIGMKPVGSAEELRQFRKNLKFGDAEKDPARIEVIIQELSDKVEFMQRLYSIDRINKKISIFRPPGLKPGDPYISSMIDGELPRTW